MLDVIVESTNISVDSAAVLRVYAKVALQSQSEREAILEKAQDRMSATSYERWLATVRSQDDLHLLVSLAAEDSLERRINSDGWCFGIGGPRPNLDASTSGSEDISTLDPHELAYRISVVDIQGEVDYMLGRDAQQGRPPELSWGGLITALARAGILATPDDLMALPLTLELEQDVEAELRLPN